MRSMAKVLLATVFAAGLATAADAKTLIYCSEASPEGFDPALYTAGTTFDAASRTVYNRLVEFKHGSTEVEPGLAISWDMPLTALRSSIPARETALAEPKCAIRARLRVGPIPSISSRGLAEIPLALLARWVPMAKRWASSRRRCTK